MFNLEAQCGDAWTYLAYGEECGANGICHDAVRPIGAVLWFSLPTLLGLNPSVMILGNAILMLGSVMQFFFCFLSLPRIHASNTFTKACLLFALLAVHWVFLRPTFFNTLSDVPAALFFLNGMASLIITDIYNQKKTFSVITGICWGMSYWMRSFYLYPVFLAVVIAIVITLIFKKKRHLRWLAIAMIPLCIQVSVMYQNYGKASYIDPKMQEEMTAMHLSSTAIGYDTLLHFWMPDESEGIQGLQYSLTTGNYEPIARMLWKRLYFYLGTYNSQNYVASNHKNLILPVCPDKFIGRSCWWQTGGSYDRNPENLPTGFADTVKFTMDSNADSAESKQWDTLFPQHIYTFSIYAWTDKPGLARISLKRNRDNHILDEQIVLLTSQPVRYAVSGKTLDTDDYTFGIELQRQENYTDSVFMWGAQLDDGEMSEFQERTPLNPDEIREWRPWLFVLHGLVILVCLVVLWVNRMVLAKTASGLILFFTIAMICGETLMIIAEQRFAIVPMIVLWMIFVFACFFLLTKRRRTHEPS